MKTKLSLLTLGLSAVVASSAFAGDIKPLHGGIQTALFNKSLGAGATARDRYIATCPPSTKSYHVQVRDQATVQKPVLNIQIVPGGTGPMQDGFDNNTSPESQTSLLGFSSYSVKTNTCPNNTASTYTFEVWKTAGTQGGTAPATANGAENYSVSEHCVSCANVDTGNATYQPMQNPQNQ